MTPSTTDQYQRALDLLAEDSFWDRYVDQLQAGEAQVDGRIAEQTTADIVDLTVLPVGADGRPNTTASPVGARRRKPGTRDLRSSRSTVFQRAAMAAAAGIAIIAGVAVLTPDREPEPIEVFTPTSPTATAEASVVAVTTVPEPQPTAIQSTPVPPEPTATPEPAATPNPGPTPQPEPEPPAQTSAASEGEGSAATDAEAVEEADPPVGTSDETPEAEVVDPDSPLGQVLDEINTLRDSEQLSALRLSPALSAAAHEHAWSLTDYQDTSLSRQPDFSLDPLFSEQSDPLRQLAWSDASIIGGADIEDLLPPGWESWEVQTGQGPVFRTVRSDAARARHLGDFTHIGVASAVGRFADATVIVYANYPTQDPAEPQVAVRTDGRCLARVANQNLGDRILIDSEVRIPSEAWPDTMDHVKVRVCRGIVNDVLPQFDLDSRYRVSVVRRSDRQIMGTFTCFVTSTCEAEVNLEASSAPFDIVLRKLSSDSIQLSPGQVQAVFYSTGGEPYPLVAGNGSRIIDSDFLEGYWDRISGGGWILEFDG